MMNPKADSTNKITSSSCAKQMIIVGIGASAGGLIAFETFFTEMPEDSGMAFILITHLSPDHSSNLPELVQRKTSMKVVQVTDNLKVQPNSVYVIPPDKEMSISNGYLHLTASSKPRGQNLPIDSFFCSLAQDQKSNAICIVLSGTGTDGTLGLKAIKEKAGIVMVQEPASAQHNGMPQNAITTGLVDYILPVEKMPEQLIMFACSPSTVSSGDSLNKNKALTTAFKKIFALLRTSTSHDFSAYKKNTIFRRIERRMHIHQITDVGHYVHYLQQSEKERHILFKELLIGVTSFFRDPVAFSLLKEQYLPLLFEGKSDQSQLRIWVPACSSGEEAYSIAMIIYECMEVMDCHLEVQIFATDIDEDSIQTARAGIYPDSIVEDIDSHLLQRFFTKEGDTFQVKKVIREMIIFASQNIIKDPPFSKLDLISCRNLLIYFEPELQKQIFPIFHYSLQNNGILFLGSSESTSQGNGLFTCLEKKWKFFTPITPPIHNQPTLYFPAFSAPKKNMTPKDITLKKNTDDVNKIRLLNSIITQCDMPAFVIIDDQANVTYIHGRTGNFLEPAQGETNVNLLSMARDGLEEGLKNAIQKTSIGGKETVVKGLHVKNNGGSLSVDLTVRSFSDSQTAPYGLMMVIFEPVTLGEPAKSKQVTKSSNKNKEYQKLEEELLYTKQNLQMTIEEVETSNEELISTNEELQSTNEELQSTNEELETSKEELQSLNEESATINVELQSRIDALVQANDDIKNLLDATEIATVFLNNNFELRKFTPTATKIFPLNESDIGRPINHFSSNLVDFDLYTSASKVLENLNMLEMEVRSNNEKTYRMRIRAYRTLNNVIDGVVVTFEDITQVKNIEAQFELSSSSFEEQVIMMSKLFMDNVDPIIIEDLNGVILNVNSAAINSFGWSREELIGKPAIDFWAKEDSAQIKKARSKCLEGSVVRAVKGGCKHKSGQESPALLTFSLLSNKVEEPQAIATMITIT